MNTLTSRFDHVLDRYGSCITVNEEYEKLELDYAMKSINLEKEEFSNFVKTDQNEQYKILKSIYKDYKEGKNILDRFKAYDVELYSKNTQRLSNILSYNNMQEFNNFRTSEVLKYELKDSSNKLRVYIEKEVKDGKCTLVVRLIDLFHLAIPSRHKGISAETMRRRTYNKHKCNKTSINKIKQEYKKYEEQT